MKKEQKNHMITVFNQKGGVGKTLVAANLAYTWGKEGNKVLVLNLDQQRSIKNWVDASNTDFPADFMDLSSSLDDLDPVEIINKISEISEEYDFTIVDCPPYLLHKSSTSSVAISDIVLIPVTPSPSDIPATLNTLDIVKNIQSVNENIEPVIFMNMADRTKVTDLVIEMIKGREFESATRMKTSLSRLTSYKEAFVLGIGVKDYSRAAAKAKIEFQFFADELKELLEGKKK